jgi:transcription factor C subunit 6
VDKSKLPKLGILAVIQLDGSVTVYSVPHPLAIRDCRKGKGIQNDGDLVRPLYRKSHHIIISNFGEMQENLPPGRS